MERMNGVDKDLAAHFTITYHRGTKLYGREIRSVFEEVSSEAYMDSIWSDIQEAKEDILANSMYMTLNLCRVLAYKTEKLIVSKLEGGEWAMKHISVPAYQKMILDALKEYKTGETMEIDHVVASDFAEYMLQQIREKS